MLNFHFCKSLSKESEQSSPSVWYLVEAIVGVGYFFVSRWMKYWRSNAVLTELSELGGNTLLSQTLIQIESCPGSSCASSNIKPSFASSVIWCLVIKTLISIIPSVFHKLPHAGCPHNVSSMRLVWGSFKGGWASSFWSVSDVSEYRWLSRPFCAVEKPRRNANAWSFCRPARALVWSRENSMVVPLFVKSVARK